ncbi:MAG: fumarylacetoacetate hydrolase family protein [Flavobacteriaceae bacterium]
MKLVRFGASGKEKPGLVDEDGTIRDLSGVIQSIDADALSDRTLARLSKIKTSDLPAVTPRTRLGSPVPMPYNFIAVGLNYADHAAESGQPTPREPILFTKSPGSLCGPYDDVRIPKGSKKLDWEVELAFVIGRGGDHIPKKTALDHIAGYMVCNDVSERAFQLEGTGQWLKGKSAPTLGPCGPWLVTRDEIANPQKLEMWLDVDGRRMQTGTTANMIFPVRDLVAYISRFLTLLPGDIVTTGTPPGVGMGRNPKVFLKAGNIMTLGIDCLGEQRQKVAAARP